MPSATAILMAQQAFEFANAFVDFGKTGFYARVGADGGIHGDCVRAQCSFAKNGGRTKLALQKGLLLLFYRYSSAATSAPSSVQTDFHIRAHRMSDLTLNTILDTTYRQNRNASKTVPLDGGDIDARPTWRQYFRGLATPAVLIALASSASLIAVSSVSLYTTAVVASSSSSHVSVQSNNQRGDTSVDAESDGDDSDGSGLKSAIETQRTAAANDAGGASDVGANKPSSAGHVGFTAFWIIMILVGAGMLVFTVRIARSNAEQVMREDVAKTDDGADAGLFAANASAGRGFNNVR
jgi:hypothetical protein